MRTESLLAADDCLSWPDVGSASWWLRIQACGTPLQCGHADDALLALTFVWRDPDGDETESDVRQVYIDVYSHTPHPTQSLTSLKRVPGTDVWFWRTTLPFDWCGSYFLMPAKVDQLPPPIGAKAIRQWWCALLGMSAQADEFNAQLPHGNGWGQSLSPLRLRAQRHVAPAFGKGRLRQWRWCSESLRNERNVWLYSTPAWQVSQAKSRPLLILMDGHYWATQMPVFAGIDALVECGDMPPVDVLLIDALSPGDRAREMACHEPFWQAIHTELMPQVFEQRLSSRWPELTLIAGQSMGGLAAMYAALNWPERYSMVLSQSGSFWWPDASNGDESAWLTKRVHEGQWPAGVLRVHLQYGCYEDEGMQKVSQDMAAALRASGHDASITTFRGGHDWLCWYEGLLDGLRQLLRCA